jgi:hypothetical protein
MTTTERPLPPVVCAPWCEGRNHHLSIDRACWGPARRIPIASADYEQDRFCAMAYRPDEHSAAGVKIHLELIRWDVDVDPVLTTSEARDLIQALQAAVDQLEGSRSPDGT